MPALATTGLNEDNWSVLGSRRLVDVEGAVASSGNGLANAYSMSHIVSKHMGEYYKFDIT